jgi:hypothetical protein
MTSLRLSTLLAVTAVLMLLTACAPVVVGRWG